MEGKTSKDFEKCFWRRHPLRSNRRSVAKLLIDDIMKIRTGFGYDVHQLEEGIEFWLGGIKMDYHKGAIGHSDADVLIHAICDALLGAANLRDIGYHFSDNDPALKGIESKILLKNVVDELL